MAACPNCSAPLPAQARSCPACGADLGPGSNWARPPAEQAGEVGCGTVVLMGILLSIPCFWGAAFLLGYLCQVFSDGGVPVWCGHNGYVPLLVLWMLFTIALTTFAAWRLSDWRAGRKQ